MQPWPRQPWLWFPTRASVGRTLYVLKTLHFQTICPTYACTTPVATRRVQSEAADRMPKLVAPDGIMYVVNDTGPDQADLAERRADLPPKKNLNQLLGWCGLAGVTSQTTGSYWTKSRGPRMMVSTFRSSVPPLAR